MDVPLGCFGTCASQRREKVTNPLMLGCGNIPLTQPSPPRGRGLIGSSPLPEGEGWVRALSFTPKETLPLQPRGKAGCVPALAAHGLNFGVELIDQRGHRQMGSIGPRLVEHEA
jgi:hypothetical protein